MMEPLHSCVDNKTIGKYLNIHELLICFKLLLNFSEQILESRLGSIGDRINLTTLHSDDWRFFFRKFCVAHWNFKNRPDHLVKHRIFNVSRLFQNDVNSKTLYSSQIGPIQFKCLVTSQTTEWYLVWHWKPSVYERFNCHINIFLGPICGIHEL